MKIVQPSAELFRVTADPEILIEQAGRKCYKSDIVKCSSCHGTGGNIVTTAEKEERHECPVCKGKGYVDKDYTSNPDVESARKFVERIMGYGHESVIEHASATIVFVTDRGCCYSDDTDVLTNEGWKPWPDVRGDELFATINDSHEVEYQHASELVVEDWNDEMYVVQSSLINLCVTPNHRMYVQKHDTQAARRGEEKFQRYPAHEIYGKRVKYKRNAEPVKGDGKLRFDDVPEFVTEQGNRDGKTQAHTREARSYDKEVFAEFLGYWISEGALSHAPGSAYNIELYQNRGPVLERMKETIRALGYETFNESPNHGKNHRLRFCDASLYEWLKPFSGSINKRIPREVLDTFSANELEILLDAYIAGDGSVHKTHGHVQGYTISRGLADDLQELALKIGISATTWVDDRVGKQGGLPGIIHRHPCYVISFVTAKNEPLVNHGSRTFKGQPHEDWIEYSGKVYCVVVPNHTLYVRRNGRPCWCGNTHELVRHRIGSYSQESTRYCNYSKDKHGNEITVLEPPGISERGREAWVRGVEIAEHEYMVMLEAGDPPQIARSVLPNCLKTEIVTTFDFREWRHFFRLRMGKRAHPQIRQIAAMAWLLLTEVAPAVFNTDEFCVLFNDISANMNGCPGINNKVAGIEGPLLTWRDEK